MPRSWFKAAKSVLGGGKKAESERQKKIIRVLLSLGDLNTHTASQIVSKRVMSNMGSL